MLTELNCTNKVAGAKQVKRALNDDRVLKLFVAGNADPRVTQPLAQQAVTRGIRYEGAGTSLLHQRGMRRGGHPESLILAE